MANQIQIVNSGVPRLLDVEVPLQEMGWFQKVLQKIAGGELNAQNGVLFWKCSNGGYAKTELSDSQHWLNVGRAWVLVTAKSTWQEIGPDTKDPTLLMAKAADFGRMQFALEPGVINDEGKGKVVFRVAWLPSAHAWDLVFSPSKNALQQNVTFLERPIIAIDLGDITLMSPKARHMDRPSPYFTGLNFGTCPLLQQLECVDSKFSRTAVDVLAIDFGTHQTNLATWPIGTTRLVLNRHPVPWFYQSISWKITAGAGNDVQQEVSVEGFDDDTFKCPEPIVDKRPTLPKAVVDTFGFDSVSLQIPSERRGHSLFEEVALGAECRQLLKADESLYADLRPSPKLFLATVHNQPAGADSRVAKSGEVPVVYSFLREVFNSYATRVSMDQDRATITEGAQAQKREVRPILYSYPISFTTRQMNDLKQSFRDALNDSTLRRSVQEEHPEQFDLQPFADESTAAAMGVLFHRFGTLAMRRIADAYRPFEPGKELSERIHPINVLCLDLGGGTSDLVLFTIDEARSLPGLEVVIKASFGFPRAGLAVTQQIACQLKRNAKQQLEGDQQRDQYLRGFERLKTNFVPIALGQEPKSLSKNEQARYSQRRLRTQTWYDVSERIKKELCDPATDVVSLTSEDIKQLGLEGLGIKPNEICIRKDELATITRGIFAPAIKCIKDWLSKYPVDMVVLSGRSFRLPGLRSRFDELFADHNKAVNEAAGELGRPLRKHDIIDLDWLKANFGLLNLYFSGQIDFDKALVPIGLIEKYNLQILPFEGDYVHVTEASDARRTRYIGAAKAVMTRASPFFEVEHGRLFEADHKPINPEIDIAQLDLSGGAVRVCLCVNFLGPGRLIAKADDVEDCVDPPRHLGTIDIAHNANVEKLEGIRLKFRQQTATSVELIEVAPKLQGTDPDPVVISAQHRKDGKTEVETKYFTLTWTENVILDDFRLDGKIDELVIDKDDTIDFRLGN